MNIIPSTVPDFGLKKNSLIITDEVNCQYSDGRVSNLLFLPKIGDLPNFLWFGSDWLFNKGLEPVGILCVRWLLVGS
jgi:hypothetical protein